MTSGAGREVQPPAAPSATASEIRTAARVMSDLTVSLGRAKPSSHRPADCSESNDISVARCNRLAAEHTERLGRFRHMHLPRVPDPLRLSLPRGLCRLCRLPG